MTDTPAVNTHIPCWGVMPQGREFEIYMRRISVYDTMHHWRSHPARETAIASAIGFASKR